MTTMEERANKFALEKHPYSPFCEEYAKMYIEIATEQRAIDDEEQGKALLYAVHKTAERTKREMIEKAKRAFCKAKECVPYEECHRANGGCFAMQRFIKSMEE